MKKYKIAATRSIKRTQQRSHFWLYSPREKLHNCVWVFTIGDSDDHPSVPHAHAVEYGYRLNAWTGEIFPAGNERENTIGHLKKKELNKLHSDKQFIDFSKKQIDWYMKAYPDIHFFVPDWFKNKYINMKLHSRKIENEKTTLVFKADAIIHK